jgi:hypothetical protein
MYVIQQWKRISILLCVQIVGKLATLDNIFYLMLKCLVEYGGLGLEELVGKLVIIKCDDNNVFKGHKSKVTLQFKEKVTPLDPWVHCFAHKMNLIIITLSNVPMVHQLKLLLHNLYIFFAHSLKKFAKFQKFINLLQGNKLLCNVKT